MPPRVTYSAGTVGGEAGHKKTCVNCYGSAEEGIASFPKTSSKEISYTTAKREANGKGM